MSQKPLLGPIKTKGKSSTQYTGSSDLMRKSLDIQKTVTVRLQIFALVIVVAFFAVLVRLYQVQILKNEYYSDRLEVFNRRYQYVTTPRGEIYDRHGQVLVSNSEQLLIVYTPPLGVSERERWDLAYRFADTFDVSLDQLRERDLKDMFILLHNDEAETLITSQEWADYYARKLTDMDIYYLKIERITSAHLQRFNERDRKAFVIKQAMDMPTGGRAKVVKSNVSKEEVAFLVEHAHQFRGFDVTINWNRDYPTESTLRPILGSVSTSAQGLPAENLLYYLALDYARNDNIGRSGLESQYEFILRGSRTIYSLDYDETGLAILSTIQEGHKGNDLITSIDLGWQLHAEEVIRQALLANENNPYRKFMNTIYFTMMDPKNGDVLVMVGITRTENGFLVDPAMNYTHTIVPGSIVKGATIYAGLNEGVVRPNEFIMDEPIKIRDTPLKASHRNLGRINDITALSMSSNVYMFHIAMRLGGASYVYDGPLRINTAAFDTMRNYYSQFGLGTLTQIDLPNEQTGFKGSATLGGLLLDYSIGQYDTYTNLQMAQYISTIANDGIRVAPRVATSAVWSGTNTVTYQNEVKVLSILDNQNALDRIQSGFRDCVTIGLCRSALTNFNTPIAAKTGTAQATTPTGEQSPNSTLVAYAPYDAPEVAISCAIPNSWNDRLQSNLCLNITAEILKYKYE